MSQNIVSLGLRNSAIKNYSKIFPNKNIKPLINKTREDHFAKIDLIELASLKGFKFRNKRYKVSDESGRSFNLVGKEVQTKLRDIKKWKQSIINQYGTAILGLVAKKFDSFFHFLVQVKIELSNINIFHLSTNLIVSKSNYISIPVCPSPNYFNVHLKSDLKFVKKPQIFEKLDCASKAFNFQEIKKIVQINKSKYKRHRLRSLEF